MSREFSPGARMCGETGARSLKRMFRPGHTFCRGLFAPTHLRETSPQNRGGADFGANRWGESMQKSMGEFFCVVVCFFGFHLAFRSALDAGTSLRSGLHSELRPLRVLFDEARGFVVELSTTSCQYTGCVYLVCCILTTVDSRLGVRALHASWR